MSQETPEQDKMDGLLMKYFVLKPHGDDRYALASRVAMRAYARIIAQENPALAADLHEWAGREDVLDPWEVELRLRLGLR